MPKDFIIYGKNSCPYCRKAKQFLTDKGIAFSFIEIQYISDIPKDIPPSQDTVPVIFYKNIFIGGYSELLQLKN